jgi:hypothetical protein
LAKDDAEQQQAFEKQMELIKKLITPDMILLYVDEMHIRSYQILRTTWSEVGQQKQAPTYGHHAHISLFGAVNVLNWIS